MDRIIKNYEKKHLTNIKKSQKKLKRAYYKAIDKIFSGIPIPKKKDKIDIKKYPRINKIIDEVLAEWSEEFLIILINGIHESWNISDRKLEDLLSKYTAGKILLPKIKEALISRNDEALMAFLKRAAGPNGLDLSQRVWKYQNQFRSEIEQNLAVGIYEGISASKLATQQKKFLQEPDRLYRRVRDLEGNLVLSKAAQQYKPGRGIYRSSYKNALRMTRTEINMAYRSADMDKYSNSSIVLGFEVRLSPNHPKFDICDHLAGNYPKTFKFLGWHPQCMCYTIPILPSRKEFEKFENALLSGESYTFKGEIRSVPKNYTRYAKQ